MDSRNKHIYLKNDNLVIFGKIVELKAHYMLPIYRAPSDETVHTVLFGRASDDTDKVALKLNRQLAHLTAYRLKRLLSKAGRNDKNLFDRVVKATSPCPTC